jgi:hypothetical protein
LYFRRNVTPSAGFIAPPPRHDFGEELLVLEGAGRAVDGDVAQEKPVAEGKWSDTAWT